MQEAPRRSQKERGDSLRLRLIPTARDLFVHDGFAATAAFDIVAKAGVTQGAPNQHSQDKADLFAAGVTDEGKAVPAGIALSAFRPLRRAAPAIDRSEPGETWEAALHDLIRLR